MRGDEFEASDSKGQEQPRFFLIGSRGKSRDEIKTCPYASTIVGYSLSLERTIILAVTCKRWGCSFCGPCKVRKLATVAMGAKPTTLITLTVATAMHENPRAAYESTRRKLPTLSRTIRRNVKEFEYMRVLEVTKKGWPHYHLVARTGYIPQRKLSAWWKELTGAPIVDIRKIGKRENAYWYVVKYLSKQEYIPWTNRRVTMSKNFKRKEEKEEFEPLQLEAVERHGMTPDAYLFYHCEGQVMERISTLIIGFASDQEVKKRELEALEESAGDEGEA